MTRHAKGLLLTLFAALLCSAAEEAERGPGVSFTRAEKEEFLRTAEIIKIKYLGTGITNSQRATLSDGHLTHDAHVQKVDIRKSKFRGTRGVELDFRDSYKFNVAAYRLDKLLGLGMVPVAVEREVQGRLAAVTWWIDDVKMTELERVQNNIRIPPQKVAHWNDQVYQARVFNELIFNTDPNLGNHLIAGDWRLWIIDFTRAFRTHHRLREPDNLVRIDRRLLEGLRRLNRETLRNALYPLLEVRQILSLLARRDLIVDYFDEQITVRGEAAVISNREGH